MRLQFSGAGFVKWVLGLGIVINLQKYGMPRKVMTFWCATVLSIIISSALVLLHRCKVERDVYDRRTKNPMQNEMTELVSMKKYARESTNQISI